MKISVIIPCYRSEKTLDNVVQEIIQVLATIKDADDYEIIMVNDCSPDNVWQVITRLCSENSHCKGLELAKNFGQHAAILAGYKHVTGDYIVKLDDDGQSPIESIPSLIAALRNNADVVYGAYPAKKHNLFRNLGSKVDDWMAVWLVGKPRNFQVSSFSAARRFVVDEMIRYDNPFPYLLGLSTRTTRHLANVSVNHRAREQGKSGYTFSKLIKLWLNGFTAFSVKPLRLATFLGFLFAILGFMSGTLIVVRKLLNPEIAAGYSSIMATIVLIGGLLMMLMGMLGEYVGRIYICLNKSPQYVIRNTVGFNKNN